MDIEIKDLTTRPTEFSKLADELEINGAIVENELLHGEH